MNKEASQTQQAEEGEGDLGEWRQRYRDRAQDIKDRAIILNFTSTEECFGAASLWLGYWLSPDLKLSSSRTSLPGVYVSFSSSGTRFLSWYHNGPVIRCCCYGIAHTVCTRGSFRKVYLCNQPYLPFQSCINKTTDLKGSSLTINMFRGNLALPNWLGL